MAASTSPTVQDEQRGQNGGKNIEESVADASVGNDGLGAKGSENGVDGVEEEEQEDRSAAQCIWIARVRPEDCEGIVKFTVLQGKVVKPERQLRGGFDRERGLVSW